MVPQYKQQLDGIMQHEVSRSEFLKLIGIGLLGFIGVMGFLKNLREFAPARSSAKNHSASGGYGRSAYGR